MGRGPRRKPSIFSRLPCLRRATTAASSAPAPPLGPLFPDIKLQTIKWFEWNTRLIVPLDPLFGRVAKILMEEQTRRFGTSHVYAADPFIEMIPPSGDPDYLARLSRAIFDGMAQSDPKAVWVLQGWPFMYKTQFLDAAALQGVP